MAMKLHFKRNAIVRFYLNCKSNINACGKVIEVNENEVVFIPQEYVSKTNYEEHYGTNLLDQTISVDNTPEMHLDRTLIGMWTYEPVPNDERTTWYRVLQPSEIIQNSDYNINAYDNDGLCKGQGDFFE